jgi:hypothetical protein
VNPRWLFQAFPFPRLPEATEQGLQPWAVGCHISRGSTELVEFVEGPLRIIDGQEREFASPAEIRRLARFTVAEGAPGISYWGWPDGLSVYPEAFDAIADVHRDVGALGGVRAGLRPYPVAVGVLYSTSTEVLEQPWRSNTLERWQHLHAWESVLYTFRRSHVLHRVVLESEVNEASLAGLQVLVLSGVRFLARPVAEQIEARVRQGRMQVLADSESIHLAGATVVEFDPYFWYQKQLDGYRQPRYLEEQRRRLAKTLVPRLLEVTGQKRLVDADNVVSFAYLDARAETVLFVVNWDLDQSAEALLPGVTLGQVRDLLASPGSAPAAVAGGVSVSVSPAGWRVISLATTAYR